MTFIRASPGIGSSKCTTVSIDGDLFFLHFAPQQNLTRTEAAHK
jgi:hypothetical protein